MAAQRGWIFQFTFLLAGLFGAEALSASTIGYAVDARYPNSSSLYSVDLSAGTAHMIGSTGAQLMEGLAISPSGQLYGADDQGRLYGISTTTGAATLIGNTSVHAPALAFLGGTLIAADFSYATKFYSINTSNAAATPILTTSTTIVDSLAVIDSNHLLIGNRPLPSTPVYTALQTVDLTTGNTTLLRTLDPAPSVLSGLAFNSLGQLFGVTVGGDIIQFDPSTGAKISVTHTPISFLDLVIPQTVSPAVINPEPSSLALWILGVTAIGTAPQLRRRSSIQASTQSGDARGLPAHCRSLVTKLLVGTAGWLFA